MITIGVKLQQGRCHRNSLIRVFQFFIFRRQQDWSHHWRPTGSLLPLLLCSANGNESDWSTFSLPLPLIPGIWLFNTVYGTCFHSCFVFTERNDEINKLMVGQSWANFHLKTMYLNRCLSKWHNYVPFYLHVLGKLLFSTILNLSIRKKNPSTAKKKILKAVSNHNPGKRKNKASQVINPLFFSGRDAGGRSFLYFHLFLVRHTEVVVGGWWGRSGGHIVNNRIVIHHLIMIWQMLAPSPVLGILLPFNSPLCQTVTHSPRGINSSCLSLWGCRRSRGGGCTTLSMNREPDTSRGAARKTHAPRLALLLFSP